jgi:hypothetical protein
MLQLYGNLHSEKIVIALSLRMIVIIVEWDKKTFRYEYLIERPTNVLWF